MLPNLPCPGASASGISPQTTSSVLWHKQGGEREDWLKNLTPNYNKFSPLLLEWRSFERLQRCFMLMEIAFVLLSKLKCCIKVSGKAGQRTSKSRKVDSYCPGWVFAYSGLETAEGKQKNQKALLKDSLPTAKIFSGISLQRTLLYVVLFITHMSP